MKTVWSVTNSPQVRRETLISVCLPLADCGTEEWWRPSWPAVMGTGLLQISSIFIEFI